jgi:hypothetical protein
LKKYTTNLAMGIVWLAAICLGYTFIFFMINFFLNLFTRNKSPIDFLSPIMEPIGILSFGVVGAFIIGDEILKKFTTKSELEKSQTPERQSLRSRIYHWWRIQSTSDRLVNSILLVGVVVGIFLFRESTDYWAGFMVGAVSTIYFHGKHYFMRDKVSQDDDAK